MMLAAAGMVSPAYSLPLVLVYRWVIDHFNHFLRANHPCVSKWWWLPTLFPAITSEIVPAQIAGAALINRLYTDRCCINIIQCGTNFLAFPGIFRWRVELAIFFIMLIMMINLRGVKESGVTFAIPTYFFIIMMYITIIVGLIRYFSGTLGIVANPPELTILAEPQALGLFLILKAFASGTASVTGVEAISDGITAFREPRSKNAGTTLIFMAINS